MTRDHAWDLSSSCFNSPSDCTISSQVLSRTHKALPGSMQVLPSPPGSALTFSVVMSVSASCRFCVKMMLNTAWERLLVSFMLVAATVLRGEDKEV